MLSAFAWFTKICRPSGAVSESNVIHRTLQIRHERVRIIGRDDDRVLVLRGERIDVRDLRGRPCIRRPDHLAVALELLDCVHAAVIGDHFVRVVDLLRHECDLQPFLDAGRMRRDTASH
jgi:hypothetical protein